MYLQTGNGLGSGLSTIFDFDLEPGAQPVSHALRKSSCVKSEFFILKYVKCLIQVFKRSIQEIDKVLLLKHQNWDLDKICIYVVIQAMLIKFLRILSFFCLQFMKYCRQIKQSLGGSKLITSWVMLKVSCRYQTLLKVNLTLHFVTKLSTSKFIRMPFVPKQIHPLIFRQ